MARRILKRVILIGSSILSCLLIFSWVLSDIVHAPYQWWDKSLSGKFLFGPKCELSEISDDTLIQLGPSDYYYLCKSNIRVRCKVGELRTHTIGKFRGHTVYHVEVDWGYGDCVLQVTEWAKDKTPSKIYNIYLTQKHDVTLSQLSDLYSESAAKDYDKVRGPNIVYVEHWEEGLEYDDAYIIEVY